MRTRSVILSLLVIAFLPRSAAAQGKTGTLTGTVVAREGGRPVPDAALAIDGTGLTGVANGVGRFRIENVPASSSPLVPAFCSSACLT